MIKMQEIIFLHCWKATLLSCNLVKLNAFSD